MKKFNHINVENLFDKVEKFYKTFYINKLIKGLITSFGIIIGLFLTFNVIFYYASIPNWLRYGLFYGFIICLFFSIYYWVVIPITKLFRVREGLSSEEAAGYIGTYFSEIGDKLVNTLQLHSHAEFNDLASAALNQNSQGFERFEFQKAAPGVNSDKRLWFALVPFLFFTTVWFSNSSLITKGTERFVNYETDYSLIPPFSFDFNSILSVREGEDIEFFVELNGEEIPQQLWINLDGRAYKMFKSGNQFTYSLKNVTSNLEFKFSDGKFSSVVGTVDVMKVPVLDLVEFDITYPSYLNKENVLLKNPSFLEIPSGSVITINGTGKYYESSVLKFNKEFIEENKNFGKFRDIVCIESGLVSIILYDLQGKDYVSYVCEIQTIMDERPFISAEEVVISKGTFVGNISDDHGVKKLEVHIKNNIGETVERVPFVGSDLEGDFSYVIDAAKLDSDVSVQFYVYDNDVANGYKLAKSKIFEFNVISEEELLDGLTKDSEKLDRDFERALDRSKKLEKEIKMINSELMNKKELSWTDEQKVQKIANEKSSLEEQLKDLENEVKNFNRKVNELERPSQEVLDKQEQIEDLLEKLLDEDSKKMLEELQEMLENLDKETLQKQLQEMEKNQGELNQDLERDLEILKQMEVERQFDLNKSKLDSLNKRLKEELDKEYGKKDSEEQLSNQKDLEKELADLKKDFEKMDSLNQKLDDPNELGLDKDKMDEASKDMKESSESMEKSDSKSGEKKQSEAQEKMEDMLEKMESSASLGGGSQEGEDLDALRRILENLLVLSFDQEANMMQIKMVYDSDPRFVELTKEQLELLDNSKLIRDSLNALSVRVPQIKSTITKEVKDIEDNMGYSIDELQERHKSQAGLHQQKSLTAINNLAVLLDEIIQQMQEQQKKKNKGDGSCSKPGEGNPKPSMGESKKKQEQLAKQIEKMKKGLEKGQKPGKMNPGQIGSGMSGEVAKLAAQQEQIRQEIRKMRDELQKEGNLGGAGSLKQLEKMLDENEEDLINLNLDNEFFARQNEIEVKMLEAENATREREREKKRESVSKKMVQEDSKDLLKEYLKMRQKEIELLRLEQVRFTGYYKKHVGQFDHE